MWYGLLVFHQVNMIPDYLFIFTTWVYFAFFICWSWEMIWTIFPLWAISNVWFRTSQLFHRDWGFTFYKGCYLSQSKYIQDLLTRLGLIDTQKLQLMDLHLQLRPTDGVPLEDPPRYWHFASSLVYLTVTRPDIAHAVHILSHFMSAPTSVHCGHLLCVLEYVRGTSSQCLFYARNSPLHLYAYSESTWASDPIDHCSMTCYCILLGSSLLTWKSKKQVVVSKLLAIM
jgi:hypothetical protein